MTECHEVVARASAGGGVAVGVHLDIGVAERFGHRTLGQHLRALFFDYRYAGGAAAARGLIATLPCDPSIVGMGLRSFPHRPAAFDPVPGVRFCSGCVCRRRPPTSEPLRGFRRWPCRGIHCDSYFDVPSSEGDVLRNLSPNGASAASASSPRSTSRGGGRAPRAGLRKARRSRRPKTPPMSAPELVAPVLVTILVWAVRA